MKIKPFNFTQSQKIRIPTDRLQYLGQKPRLSPINRPSNIQKKKTEIQAMDANKFNAALGIKKMTHHGNNLVWALDSVVRNAELISDKYLSVPDFKGRPLTYDYLRIKGAE